VTGAGKRRVVLALGHVFNVCFVAMISSSAFYTAFYLDPKDIAENIKEAGGLIPASGPSPRPRVLDRVRPGSPVGRDVHLRRGVCVPMVLTARSACRLLRRHFAPESCSALSMDFCQIEVLLISRLYEGLMGKQGRIKGRR
jgi:preprotein translocase subunit SecY